MPIALGLLLALFAFRLGLEGWVFYIEPRFMLGPVTVLAVVVTLGLAVGLLLRREGARRSAYLYGGFSLFYVLMLWLGFGSLRADQAERFAYFLWFYQIIFGLHVAFVFLVPAVCESAAVRKWFAAKKD